jgi:hypothetical protein
MLRASGFVYEKVPRMLNVALEVRSFTGTLV